MEYTEGQIVFTMGHWFRVKKVTGPGSRELDLLSIEETRAHEMKLIEEFQEEEKGKRRNQSCLFFQNKIQRWRFK